MIYLIGQVWGPLLVAALCGAVAGWFWHAARLRPKQKALEAERRRLRGELLDLAVGLQPVADAPAGGDENAKRRIAELERALAEARGRGAEADVLRRRLDDLERESGHPRPVAALDVTDYTTRISALEVEIEAARRKILEAEALQARVATLQAKETPDADLMRWRARYFEARTGCLEQESKNAAEALTAAQARPIPPEKQEDEQQTQLFWRNRYLTERLKYVSSAAPNLDAADPEADNRRRWRLRYLEQRVAHLEVRPPPPVDVAPLHTRIAELEQKGAEHEAAATKLIETEDEVIRARWTARYLQARVTYLESRASAAIAEEQTRKAAEEAAKKAAAEDAARKATEEAARKAAEAAAKKAADEAAQRAAQDSARKAREAEDAARRAAEDAARIAREEAAKKFVEVSAPAPEPVRQEPEVFRMERPAPLAAARGGAPDDFSLIKGVTPQNETALRALGVHHYDQIASWTPAHAAWVNQYLNLRGRIGDEHWIEQAQKLAAGS